MPKHNRTQDAVESRIVKRIAVSIDTLLRHHFQIEVDSSLANPQPVPRHICHKYLIDLIEAAETIEQESTQVMSPISDGSEQ